MKVKRIKFLTIFLLIITFSFGQKLTTSIDTISIKIGEEITYTLEINQKTNENLINQINFQLKNSKIELNKYFVDNKDNKTKYLLKFTSFEAGKQTIPSFNININDEMLQTSPYQITVLDVQIDENKPFKDIKPIVETPLTFWDYLKWYKTEIIFCLLILLLIIFIWLYFKKKKKSSNLDVKISIYEKTINQLNELNNKELTESHHFREVYIKLSEIVKNYLTEKFEIPAKVLLTKDLTEHLIHKRTFENSQIEIIKNALITSDYVKFAKFNPSTELTKQHIQQTINIINLLEKQQEIHHLTETKDLNQKPLNYRKI